MIWPKDGVRLAYTKLRTRRIRLGVTLFISSLLFIAVATALFMVRGVISSLEGYSKSGLGSRYIIMASPAYDIASSSDNTTVVRAQELDKQLISRKIADAKRLGIDYDPASEQPAVTSFQGPNGKLDSVNINSPSGLQAQSEYIAKNPLPGIKDLKAAASNYDMVGIYTIRRLGSFNTPSTYLQVLEKGKESYETNLSQNFGNPTDLKAFSSNLQVVSESLLDPFVLPNQNAQIQKDGVVPVFAPYSALEPLLGIKSLPKNATSKQKLAHLQEIRTKAANYRFEACYRNNSSNNLLNAAISTQEEITKNKSNKNYEKPNYITELPKTACGDIVIARDVRTKEDKVMAAKQLEFNRDFGEQVPIASIVTFRIVGIVPDTVQSSTSSALQIVQSILTSSVGNGWFVPAQASADHPVLSQLFKDVPAIVSNDQYFVEVKSAESAQKFLDEKNCNPDYSKGYDPSLADSQGPYAECHKLGKSFMLSTFGSNSLAIEDFKNKFAKYFKIVLLVITVLASLIMMGIMSRVIADSRRETAVFRAIGAKRLDIAQIYLTYIFMICTIVGIIATFTAIAFGTWVQSRYSLDVKIAASIAFNAPDSKIAFSFCKVLPQDLLVLWGVIFLTGLIAASIPLLTNVRRNPIRDMRDER
jgi:ABC-type antimicrobial peptide transport system permease subunit